MEKEKYAKEIFIEDFKTFERMIKSRYNPSSVGTCDIGIVKLYEIYLNKKRLSNN